jgi:hypothetical protein
MANSGVSLAKNMRGEGRICDFGEVMRLSSAAVRPTTLTVATIPAPRQMLPREVPVARCTAAVVISSGCGWDGSSLRG